MDKSELRPTEIRSLSPRLILSANITLVFAIPVSADPSIAGSADGNLASGIVPDDRLLALKELIIEDVTNAAPLVS